MTMIARAIEFITGTAIDRDSIVDKGWKYEFKYKGTSYVSSLDSKLVRDTIYSSRKSLQGRYSNGGKADDKSFNEEGKSSLVYHEKQGNWIVPKGQVYFWLYEGEDSAEKVNNGEYDFVQYPLTSRSMAWQSGYIPPLKRIWTKKFQKDHKGSEHLLGVIKSYLIEKDGKKELYIDMMSVNPKHKKEGIMTYMIQQLRERFKLSQDQITFSDLTKEGEKFVAKKTYADGGGVEKSIRGFKIGDTFYKTPSTSGNTRYFKITSIDKNYLKADDYDFVLNGEDIRTGRTSTYPTVTFQIMVDEHEISRYERGDLYYSDGGGVKNIYIHKYNPNITLEFIENTTKGIKGLQKNPKSLSKKERNEGIIVNYSDSEIKELFDKKYREGGDVPNEDKMFQLPLEMVVYVPSTQDVDKVISVDEMDKRVDEVKQYLASKFGGYSATDKLGGFVDSTGKLVNEDVVQVTAFSTKEAYQEHKEELIKQLSIWGKKWGQEAIGFEFEGDLMYVPQDIYASGGLINDVFDVKDLKKYLVYKKAGFSYHYIFDIWKYEINEFNDQKGWALNTYKKYKDEWHLIESYGYEGLTLRECKEMIVMELRS